MNDIAFKRTESQIVELISTMLTTGVVKDPRLSRFLSVTRLDLAKDLSFAKVHISSFESDAALDQSVAILNKAAGLLQARIGKALRSRNTPRLRFIADHSIREGLEVNRRIEDLKNE